MSSPQRLAARMPAMRAVLSTSPLGTFPAAMARIVAGASTMKPSATASRAVTGLWPTSTIRGLPERSRWVRRLLMPRLYGGDARSRDLAQVAVDPRSQQTHLPHGPLQRAHGGFRFAGDRFPSAAIVGGVAKVH